MATVLPMIVPGSTRAVGVGAAVVIGGQLPAVLPVGAGNGMASSTGAGCATGAGLAGAGLTGAVATGAAGVGVAVTAGVFGAVALGVEAAGAGTTADGVAGAESGTGCGAATTCGLGALPSGRVEAALGTGGFVAGTADGATTGLVSGTACAGEMIGVACWRKACRSATEGMWTRSIGVPWASMTRTIASASAATRIVPAASGVTADGGVGSGAVEAAAPSELP
jgi:hypothetical protein